MKKILMLAIILVGVSGLGLTPCRASDIIYTKPISSLSLGATTTITVPLGSKSRGVSFQLVYSSNNAAAVTFTDGHVSTGTVTVASLNNLTTSYAANNITVVSTMNLTGAAIYFNGYPLWNNGWSVQSTTYTAKSIVAAFNVAFGDVCLATVQAGSSVIFTTMTHYGSFYNSYTLTSSTPTALLVASSKFTGGNDNAIITINGYPFTANSNWYAKTTTALTAKEISDQIVADSYLSSIVSSTYSSTKVTVTSKIVGAISNYKMTSSTPTALTLGRAVMYGGTDVDISSQTPVYVRSGAFGSTMIDANVLRSSSTIYKTHAYGLGQEVVLTTTAGTAPGGLAFGTTYFVIANPSDLSSFQLASSLANALAGTAVAVTGTTETGGGTFVLTPLALSGTMVFKWQASNDCLTYTDTSATPVSFASPYTAGTYVWDFGVLSDACHRLSVSGPTHGGIIISVFGNILR